MPSLHPITLNATPSALDRMADLALFFGRYAQAERLSNHAAELREGDR